MTVLNFSYADVKDADKFQQYVQAAAVLMQEAGVEVVVRGRFADTMRGPEKSNHIAAVFRYSDMAAVEQFYNSEKYLAIVPLRDEACDMTIHLYEEAS